MKKKGGDSLWKSPSIFNCATPQGASGDFGFVIQNGYLSCWSGISSSSDISQVSSQYISDNKYFKCSIICDGSYIMFYYNKNLLFKWNCIRTVNDANFYLGYVGPENPGSNAYCQMDLQYCKIYSIAKSINNLYTDSNSDNKLAVYGYKTNGSKLLDTSGNGYDAIMYNCII